MSDSDISSASSSSDPPRNDSPAPDSAPVPESAAALTDEQGQREPIAETNASTATWANDQAIKPETKDLIDVGLNPDAEPLHVSSFNRVDVEPEDLSHLQYAPSLQRGADIDFVIVHGVNGKLDNETGSNNSLWVSQYAESLRSDSRILAFEYESRQLFRGNRSREAIRKCALRLLRALSAVRKNETEERWIVFIAYDLGGIIVKDALAAAALERTSWNEILDRSRTILFSGCPHRSVNRLDMEDRLSRFLFTKYNAGVGDWPPISSIPGLAAAVIEINGFFVESKVPLRSRVISIHAGDEPGQHIDQVFDNYCGTMGISLEHRILDPEDDFDNDLTDYIDVLHRGLSITNNAEQSHFRCERKLLSLASPVYPFQTGQSNNLVAESTEYRTWLSRPGAEMLYIHGPHRVREAAEQIFYTLDELGVKENKLTIALYFSFDRWDVRCDSIRDMLSTFIAQIISYHPPSSLPLRDYNLQRHQQTAWTEADLIYWFERLRLTAEFERLVCVINYFDECAKDSRKLFIEKFAYVSRTSERPWKVVVTSHKPGVLLDELSGTSCVALDLAASGVETDDTTGMEKELTRMMKLRPELQSQESVVREELSNITKFGPLVRHIICEQARVRPEWPEEVSIQDILGPLELVSSADRDDHNLEQILEWVLGNVTEQATLRKLLTWLLYSVRPLTIWELATALYLGPDGDRRVHASPSSSVVESLVPKLQIWLAGIIDVDQNEVKIRNPRLRKTLMGMKTKPASRGSRFLWEELRDTAHHDIARLCLDYLSRPSVQEYLDKSYQVTDPKTFETPIVADRSNLCSYAVQAWTHHFSLSPPTPELSKLLPPSALAKSWATAYWALSKRSAASDTCWETLFPIFAGLGLLNVLEPRDEADACQGLLEAASKGKARTVECLLEKYKFSEPGLIDALLAAASSGDEKILFDLLNCVMPHGARPSSIVWPPTLIHRAAWLGLDHFAEKILQLGCAADPVGKSVHDESPLCDAASNNHVATLRVLLRHEARVNFQGDLHREPLSIVAGRGYAEIAKVLVEDGKADIEAHTVDGLTALYFACVWGHHQTAETLLQMGADPDMGIPPDVNSTTWSPLVAASDGGFKRCVQLLLDKKANPNIGGPPDVGTPLLCAAVGGHVDVCGLLLAAGADPNSPLISTPILAQVARSACVNQLDVLDMLLSHGANVDARDSYGSPVLIHAVRVRNQSEAVIRRLLDHGADVNAKDARAMGALAFAVQKNLRSVVELLLEKGADVNTLTLFDRSPLHYALRHTDILRILLENGADPDFAGAERFTPLIGAALQGYTDTVKLLLEHNATVDVQCLQPHDLFEKSTALHVAVATQRADVVRLLAEHGASLTHIPASGIPSIHRATDIDVLSAMLEYPTRVDLDQVDRDGDTMLHLGISIENYRRLVNAGANPEIQNKGRGDTPLSIAGASGNLQAVECLLKHGVDVNLGSPCDGAALHQACRRSAWDVMKLLVESGADVNQACGGLAATPLLATCLQYARSEGRSAEEMVLYLLDHGANVSGEGGLLGFPLTGAAMNGTPSLVRLLLERGARTDVRDKTGRMPIHLAAFHGIDNFQEILDAGGDVNARDATGRTALHWAAQPGRAQVVENVISLLPGEEGVDAPDIDGWTPLCWAARGLSSWLDEGHAGEPQDPIRVIKLLLEKGANRSVEASVGEQRWTPLKIARFSDQPAEVIELLSRGLNHEATSQEVERVREAEENKSKVGTVHRQTCDYCACGVRGFLYHCNVCLDFDYCSKCYTHRDILHSSPEHTFEQIGPEFEPVPEGDDTDSSKSSASSDSDSD